MIDAVEDGGDAATGSVAAPGPTSPEDRPAPSPAFFLPDATALTALLYIGSGRVEEVLGQHVHRTGRATWSVNLGPELTLLTAADRLMLAAGFTPC
jgi:hypothetical protein